MLMVLTQLYDLGTIVLDSLKFFIYAPRLLVDEYLLGVNIYHYTTSNFRIFKLISFMEIVNNIIEDQDLKAIEKFKLFSSVKQARRVLMKLYFNVELNVLSKEERQEVFFLNVLLEDLE